MSIRLIETGLFLGVRNLSYSLGGVKRISTLETPDLHVSRRDATAVGDGLAEVFTGGMQPDRRPVVYGM